MNKISLPQAAKLTSPNTLSLIEEVMGCDSTTGRNTDKEKYSALSLFMLKAAPLKFPSQPCCDQVQLERILCANLFRWKNHAGFKFFETLIT